MYRENVQTQQKQKKNLNVSGCKKSYYLPKTTGDKAAEQSDPNVEEEIPRQKCKVF